MSCINSLIKADNRSSTKVRNDDIFVMTFQHLNVFGSKLCFFCLFLQMEPVITCFNISL